MITFEDRHAPTYEEAAEKFWADIQADALECSASCLTTVYGYHTGNCPRKTASDLAMERRDEAVINMALGK